MVNTDKNNKKVIMFCFGVASNCNIGIGNLQNDPNAHQYNGTSLAMEISSSNR